MNLELFGFCGGSEREYQKGDEIAWYANDDKIVWNEYNPLTSFAFGTTLGVSYYSPTMHLVCMLGVSYEIAKCPLVGHL